MIEKIYTDEEINLFFAASKETQKELDEEYAFEILEMEQERRD